MAQVATMQVAETATPQPTTDERSSLDMAEPSGVSRSDSESAMTRHSKKLSLNFPILPPLQSQQAFGLHTISPNRSPSVLTPIDSPRTTQTPIKNTQTSTTPDPETEEADVLTLIATQERRVLELREELQRTEGELSALKRKWALGEARRKNAEVKSHTQKMKRLSGGRPSAGVGEEVQKDVDAAAAKEKMLERRRTLIERSNSGGTSGGRHVARRSQQRVFSGSKHARTLSLLATSGSRVQQPARSSLDETASTNSQDPAGTDPPLPLSRTSTLPDFGFGKTYKEISNSKRTTMPPVTGEVLVRQGQKVAEGLREGLWNLFEDIRQATVGEEGVSGVQSDGRPAVQRKKAVGHTEETKKSGVKKLTEGRKEEKTTMATSFWREFGVDTPKRQKEKQKHEQSDENAARSESNKTPSAKENGATATSKNPDTIPLDLLVDLNDEDEWEAWESPIADQAESVKRDGLRAEEALPWPELKRLTSSNLNLTRSVSELMREWESGGKAAQGGGQPEEDVQVHALKLASP